ncbi:hypothetical protein FRC04_007413 [Tulasnella sp. 424]|nr:hypothetical protein FRC04_007413 [Tulasnella sp. 424]KAG8959550.1 hypothetical protein FRC05_007666 [Tulasnella sp. 425]
MAYRIQPTQNIDNGATSTFQILALVIVVSSLFVVYGYLLWTKPIAKYRSAGRIRNYLAAKSPTSSEVPYFSSSAAYSLQRAVNTFANFDILQKQSLDANLASYNRLSSHHRSLGHRVGYGAKLANIQNANKTNSILTRDIARFAEKQLGVVPASSKETDAMRVREALKHLVRDWSDEGAIERQYAHKPILNALEKAVPSEDRVRARVLLPGSGMGRLAWEISQLGFDVTANEFSNFMTLPLRYLLSEYTTEPGQHSVQPWYFALSHTRRSEDLFRVIRFPDVVPRQSSNFRLLDADFYSITQGGYNFIVTMFFIDTAVNIVQCLEQIHDLLAPGGTWINLGPLLWTSGGVARMELSLEEVLKLAELIGFEVRPGSRRQVDTEYTANRPGMMRWIYETEFWIADKKPQGNTLSSPSSSKTRSEAKTMS